MLFRSFSECTDCQCLLQEAILNVSNRHCIQSMSLAEAASGKEAGKEAGRDSKAGSKAEEDGSAAAADASATGPGPRSAAEAAGATCEKAALLNAVEDSPDDFCWSMVNAMFKDSPIRVSKLTKDDTGKKAAKISPCHPVFISMSVNDILFKLALILDSDSEELLPIEQQLQCKKHHLFSLFLIQ